MYTPYKYHLRAAFRNLTFAKGYPQALPGSIILAAEMAEENANRIRMEKLIAELPIDEMVAEAEAGYPIEKLVKRG